MQRTLIAAGIIACSLSVAPVAQAQEERPMGSAESMLDSALDWFHSLPGVGGTENFGTQLLLGIPFIVLLSPLYLMTDIELLGYNLSSRGAS
ncbi:hypothetical protein [uncultured Corynebacterium sp.]|uniref:hypothetical protein n=1 Tax=uncultured Corynebacterium sp. TaxID=159447 RepID=UPI0025F43DBD|nr:hypothetical protein [uncultured Corynebacterium sp.]